MPVTRGSSNNRFYISQETLDEPRTKTLSEDRFLEIENACVAVSALQRIEFDFHILIESYKQVEICFHQVLLDDQFERNLSRLAISKTFILINQRTLSLLTSARSHLEALPRRVRRAMPNFPGANTKAREILSDLYNANIDYRIMEMLRNYALHKELPISGISYGNRATATELRISDRRKTLDPRFDLTDRCGLRRAKPSVANELENLGIDWVDAKHTIRSFVRDIISAQSQIRSLTAVECENAKKTVNEALTDFGKIIAPKTVRFAYACGEFSDKPDRKHFMQRELLESVDQLRTEYTRKNLLLREYLSSEIIQQHPKHPEFGND